MEGALAEKYFHRQTQISHTKYAAGKVSRRYYRNIGLGFKIPKEAIESTYVDHKCPFTGDISIRGRILKGVVHSKKMQRSIIVRRDYLHYIAKYKRFEKRHKNVAAHIAPCFRVSEGDIVTIGECRPLSKSIRFNVIKAEEVAETKRKRFMQF
ncbi:Ribosomal_protein S11 [Hexamita inflata]|uniref:Small ribosomal subunit protein uS17 n=1 Tax=Hexamita inflata TaxID=28002 RepID=A0AA86NCA8_9EUKA|nr:Ribosomal protein S11 [Hexamita inflata]CAI9917074.1 Ribosomal protein S11 [Hexamita inflata]CAI9964217.1 Ribosomal protein S11 [Hexamita inflata]